MRVHRYFGDTATTYNPSVPGDSQTAIATNITAANSASLARAAQTAPVTCLYYQPDPSSGVYSAMQIDNAFYGAQAGVQTTSPPPGAVMQSPGRVMVQWYNCVSFGGGCGSDAASDYDTAPQPVLGMAYSLSSQLGTGVQVGIVRQNASSAPTGVTATPVVQTYQQINQPVATPVQTVAQSIINPSTVSVDSSGVNAGLQAGTDTNVESQSADTLPNQSGEFSGLGAFSWVLIGLGVLVVLKIARK